MQLLCRGEAIEAEGSVSLILSSCNWIRTVSHCPFVVSKGEEGYINKYVDPCKCLNSDYL